MATSQKKTDFKKTGLKKKKAAAKKQPVKRRTKPAKKLSPKLAPKKTPKKKSSVVAPAVTPVIVAVPAPKAPEVYNIPLEQPFLKTLAQGILARAGDDPLALADVTVLVPDRATGALLRQALTREMAGKPCVMPRIDTPGDMGDESLSLKISGNALLSQTLMDIPPPVPRLQRQLILAGEILKIQGMASSPQKAIKLGGELGRFLDEVQRYNIDLKDADRFVPEKFAAQWARTAEFLRILTDVWPQHLQKLGMIDPEEHRNAVIRVQAADWQMSPPQQTVIAAGFTRLSPALLELLQTVSILPKGAVVLPGADLTLDKKAWDLADDVHPQSFAKKTLVALGVGRDEVKDFSPASVAENPARRILLQESFRPAQAEEPKKDRAALAAAAVDGLELITCGTQQEEASVIALKLRECLEASEQAPDKTAALVTADRGLARRVSARLRYWQIDIDDGAGSSLADTAVGIYLLSGARMAAEDLAPVPFLEAMKHPLSALGGAREDFLSTLSSIEGRALHGPRPAGGIAGLKGALKVAFNRAAAPAAPEAEQLLDRLETAGGNFFKKMAGPTAQPFAELLDAHILFAEKLAATDKQKGAGALWRGDEGAGAARFLTKLRAVTALMPPMTGREYVDVLQGLMRDVPVRARVASHPMLKILTPEQAHLARPDVVVFGGLNDEVFPARAEENPWLSPEMMRGIGLPPAETRIGLEAHCFAALTSGADVTLLRAVRSGDAPTVPSPFLTRLLMTLKRAGIEEEIEKKQNLLSVHVAMHKPDAITPVDPPMPAPPTALRPKQLPVTAVEALMRDPYSVYAKYVLKLRPLQPIDASPTVAERGIFTHAALDAFVKKHPETLPDNAYDELLKIGEETFKTRMDNPSVQAFWWPRFERIAKQFVKFETERRELSSTLGTEVRGKIDIDLGNGDKFTLTCIADRIDSDGDNNLEVIDYKTGSVPSQKSIEKGLSPQLTLEAMIALDGGFKDIEAESVTKLLYWRLSGGKPAMEEIEVKGDIGKLIEDARQGIGALARVFNDAATPYLVAPRPDQAPRYNNYEHLSRVGEWSTVKKTTQKGKQQATTRRSPGGKTR